MTEATASPGNENRDFVAVILHVCAHIICSFLSTIGIYTVAVTMLFNGIADLMIDYTIKFLEQNLLYNPSVLVC